MTKAQRTTVEETREMLNQYRKLFRDIAAGDESSARTVVTCAEVIAPEFEHTSRKLYEMLYPEEAKQG